MRPETGEPSAREAGARAEGASRSSEGPRYAQVVFNIPLSQTFDYEVPEALTGLLQVGSRVRRPFRTTSRHRLLCGPGG